MMNILFIVIDALRADKCYDQAVRTPNIDWLTTKGLTYTQAITPVTCTTPSVASILSGHYPYHHNIRSLHDIGLNSNCSTLPELLRDKGYYTYAEVTGPLIAQTGLDRGFFSYCYRRPEQSIYGRWGKDLLNRFDNDHFKEPWFIFLHLWELHSPRRIPEESLAWQNKYLRYLLNKSPYERALSSLDSYLGELFSRIDFSDTLVIFTSDHGERIYETMWGKAKFAFRKLYDNLANSSQKDEIDLTFHGFYLYEYLIRVPLIIVGQGAFPENEKTDSLVCHIDYLATIQNIMGEGSSIGPGINIRDIYGMKSDYRDIYLEGTAWGQRLRGLRTPRYKYIEKSHINSNKIISSELYDIMDDPNETKNIAPNYPEISRKFSNKIDKIKLQEKVSFVRKKMQIH